MTNESIAKMLGWRRVNGGWLPGPTAGPAWTTLVDFPWTSPPAFTTDLNAIVGAIEGLGLCWIIALQFDGSYWASVRTKGAKEVKENTGSTHCLALCAALVAHLKAKEKP